MVLATLAIQLRREYNTVWSSIAIASTNNFKGSDKLLISTDLLQAIVLIVTWIIEKGNMHELIVGDGPKNLL